MVQIINRNPSALGNLGAGLGTGIAQSVSQYADNKMKQLLQQQNAQQLAQSYEKLIPGKTPEEYLALAQTDPEARKQYLKSQLGTTKLTPAQEKHRVDLTNQYATLEDVVQTTDRMLEALENPELNLGLYSKGAAAIYPGGLLNDTTSKYATDIEHYLNLRAADTKGLMSKFRLQSLRKDKPDLSLSKGVNKSIIEQANKEARHKLKQIQKQFPTYGFESANEEQNVQQPMQQQIPQQQMQSQLQLGQEIEQLPQPGTPEFEELPENTAYEASGILHIKSGNQWIKRKAGK